MSALVWASLLVGPGLSYAAATSQSSATCSGDNAELSLPLGFCATIFADGIGHARHLVVSPSGVVYVNTWSGPYYGNDTPHAGGFLVALQDTVGTGKADVIRRFGETVESGAMGGTGIALYRGALYAEINDKIVKYALPADALIPSTAPQAVVTGLPMDGDHMMHPFAIDSDGSMYIDSGAATNSCQRQNRTLESPGDKPCRELLTRGGIWRYDANKTDQAFSPAERFASGIRNAEGFALDKSGHRIFVTQHGRDQLHSSWPTLYQLNQEATLPAEELLLLTRGGDYGWPECYFDAGTRKLTLAPEYGGNGSRVGDCASKRGPVAYFPAHWAPNAAVFYDQAAFPARYRNGVFIAFHGSWNRAPFAQKGYNVVFQALTGDVAAGKCEIFADGFSGAEKSPGKAEHRPAGLAVGPDGALYVSDDARGRIYRIVYRGGSSGAGAIIPVPCPSATASAGPMLAMDSGSPQKSRASTRVREVESLPVPREATRSMIVLGDRVYHGLAGGATCVGCHGSDASGTPLGPNLTANRWLWSDGSYPGIAATIRIGVMHPKNYRGSMPAMGGAQLTADQVSAVASYLWALNQPPTAANSPIGATRPAQLIIPGANIYPESLTATADGRVFIGSILTRKIFAVQPGAGAAEAWISADSDPGLGVFGVFADERSHTLWTCLSPFAGSPNEPKGPATLVAYDLGTGKSKGQYPLPTSSAFCNDIAVGPDGTTYITDSANMEIDSLKSGAQQLQVWAGAGGFGDKGSILDGISIVSDRVVVNTLRTNKIFAVPIDVHDGSPGPIAEIALSRPIDQPDGMRSFGTDSVLLAESGSSGRLSMLKIQGSTGHLTTLKSGLAGGPVSVAVVGTTGYVLEGQLSALFGPAGASTVSLPFHATAVDLGTED